MSTRTQRLMLSLGGPTIGEGGARTIQRALEAVPGVVAAYVNPGTEMAYVHPDASLDEPEQLITAIERAGFHAGPPLPR